MHARGPVAAGSDIRRAMANSGTLDTLARTASSCASQDPLAIYHLHPSLPPLQLSRHQPLLRDSDLPHKNHR